MARGKSVGRYGPSRGDRKGGDDSSSRWLATYGDAVTLLMAFFVMLYAISQIDQEKFTAFVSGLEAPFGNAAAQQGILSDSSAIVGDAAQDVPANASARPEPLVLVEQPAENEDIAPAPIDLAQLEEVRGALEEALRDEGLDGVAQYRYDERGLVVSIGTDDVLFATGSTTISDLGRRIIATVAGELATFPNEIVVEGHTDDVPLSRPGYTNWNLSTDRAVAVLSMLHDVHSIPPERLGAAGYGEFRPQVPNDSPDNRAQNRRVDILIVAEGA